MDNDQAEGYTRLDHRFLFDGWFDVADTAASIFLNDPILLSQLVHQFNGSCNISNPSIQCYRDFIRGFAKRLIIRELSTEEIDELAAPLLAATPAETFSNLIRTLLLLPEFLFTSKNTGQLVEGRDDLMELTDLEVARSLALDLGHGPPSQQLIDDAESGALRDPAVFASHVDNYLTHRATVGSCAGQPWVWCNTSATHGFLAFAEQWLELGKFPGFASEHPIMRVFALGHYLNDPHHDHQAAMENDVMDLVVKKTYYTDESYQNLMTDPYINTGSPDLQRILKIPLGHTGSYLLPDHYRGLANRPFFAVSGYEYPNPILKGVYRARRLLCIDIPDPDPATLPSNFRHVEPRWHHPEQSTREAVSQQTGDAACFICHQHINPLGFVTQTDSIGRELETHETIYELTNSGQVNIVGTPLIKHSRSHSN